MGIGTLIGVLINGIVAGLVGLLTFALFPNLGDSMIPIALLGGGLIGFFDPFRIIHTFKKLDNNTLD